jgi:hypothetical protein
VSQWKKELGASSSSKPQSIAELKKMHQKGKKRKWEESLAATSDNVIDKMKTLTPLRWIALTWQGGLPQVCPSLGTKNPQAI